MQGLPNELEGGSQSGPAGEHTGVGVEPAQDTGLPPHGSWLQKATLKEGPMPQALTCWLWKTVGITVYKHPRGHMHPGAGDPARKPLPQAVRTALGFGGQGKQPHSHLLHSYLTGQNLARPTSFHCSEIQDRPGALCPKAQGDWERVTVPRGSEILFPSSHMAPA